MPKARPRAAEYVPNLDWDQFLVFCHGQLTYSDSDPHCKLFAELADVWGLTTHERVWLCLLYMAFYQDGSAITAFNIPQLREGRGVPKVVADLTLPISYQRRNLFGGRIVRHLEACMAVGDLGAWLEDVTDWSGLVKRLATLYGNGRWAAYTTAEMVCKVARPDVVPDTFDIAGSSGPASGLGFLGLPATEGAARWLCGAVRAAGIEAPDEVAESFLCNWSRVKKADFYLGHNLDRQQGRLLKVERLLGKGLPEAWEARRRIFDERCLGEVQGWEGVDKRRLGWFERTGLIYEPWEHRGCAVPPEPHHLFV